MCIDAENSDIVSMEYHDAEWGPKGAHPCTSSSGQGGGKRVLEDFF